MRLFSDLKGLILSFLALPTEKLCLFTTRGFSPCATFVKMRGPVGELGGSHPHPFALSRCSPGPILPSHLGRNLHHDDAVRS